MQPRKHDSVYGRDIQNKLSYGHNIVEDRQPWPGCRMYESMQIPPPPVRMRTKFYSPTNYDSSDYAQVYKPKNKAPVKGMANLSLNDKSETLKVQKKPEVNGRCSEKRNGSVGKKDYGKGKAPPVPKRSSSKSMSNLNLINESESSEVHYKCPKNLAVENNFRNYLVSSINSNFSLKSKNSKSMSNLSPNQKGPKFSLLHSRKYSDSSSCCMHNGSSKSSKSYSGKPKTMSAASSRSLNDSNWSLQSSSSLQYMGNGRTSAVPPPPPR